MNAPMRSNTALLLTLILYGFSALVNSSKCIVTKWRDWSECVGSCEMALRVRNRDVSRPPFPDKIKTDALLPSQNCPVLYEVEQCIPKECEDPETENPFFEIPSASGPSRQNNKATALKGEKLSAKNTTSRQRRSKISGTSLFLNNSNSMTHRYKCGKEQDEICCRISRTICPDGSRPKPVTRWYRQEGVNVCRPYMYPYCDMKYEQAEKPATTEESCLTSCFTPAEQTILSLRLI